MQLVVNLYLFVCFQSALYFLEQFVDGADHSDIQALIDGNLHSKLVASLTSVGLILTYWFRLVGNFIGLIIWIIFRN